MKSEASESLHKVRDHTLDTEVLDHLSSLFDIKLHMDTASRVKEPVTDK